MIAAEFSELKRLLRVAMFADEIVQATCADKRQFSSPEQARKILSKKRHHARLVVYRCTNCRKWHIGNHLGNKANLRRAA
jgi:hypothetical protein